VTDLPDAAAEIDEWSDPLVESSGAEPAAGDAEPSERDAEPRDADAGPRDTDEGDGGRSSGPWRSVVEWGIVGLVAVVLAVGIRAFLFQTFYIPSGSMEPTLQIGDRVLVNKLSYDLHDLHRGDIVVFTSGPNTEWHRAGIEDLVKRVIALPGETITQCDGENVCIDGKRLVESYLPKSTGTTFPQDLPRAQGDHKLVCAPESPAGGCKVPRGEVFVMGDHRDDSQDSRYNGPIKE